MRRRCRNRPFPIAAQEMQEAVNQSWISNVDVRAIADRLLQTIGQIPERIERAFHRDRNAGADFRDNNCDVDILGLETAEHRGFLSTRGRGIEDKDVPTTFSFDG